tara:strand:- start:332 stop:511 length:180 start_codon:yes stop_codon:yes gene_type:complete
MTRLRVIQNDIRPAAQYGNKYESPIIQAKKMRLYLMLAYQTLTILDASILSRYLSVIAR